MLRGIWGDDERYRETYWTKFPGCYFAGDGARRDEDGYFWIMGRVDDVLNVAGHRLGDDGDRERARQPRHGRRGRRRRPARRAQGPGDLRLRHVGAGRRARRRRSQRDARGARRARRSASSRGPARSASPRRCPRRAAARSCAASCARSPRAARPSRRHDHARGLSACSRSCATTRSEPVNGERARGPARLRLLRQLGALQSGLPRRRARAWASCWPPPA